MLGFYPDAGCGCEGKRLYIDLLCMLLTCLLPLRSTLTKSPSPLPAESDTGVAFQRPVLAVKDG